MDRAQTLIDLARKQFGDLTPAEEKMLRAAAGGKIADCTTSDDYSRHAASAGDWGDARVIHAERIAWLCTDRNASLLVGPNGVHVAAARIESSLDLSFALIPFPIALVGCGVQEPVRLVQSSVPAMSFCGTHITALDADTVDVKNHLFFCDGFEAHGEVKLLGAKIGGNLTCTKARFKNAKGKAFGADGIDVRGGVFLCDGFEAEGEVRLLNAKVGANLECDGGHFKNPDGMALAADGIEVKGSVFLRNGFEAEGEVRLPGAKIGGNLECDNGCFKTPRGTALNADEIDLGRSAFLRGGFCAEGEVRFQGARIRGSLECDSGVLKNAKGAALVAGGMDVKGDVFLRNGFEAEGEVQLLGARIGGSLVCDRGRFKNPKGVALNAGGIDAGGAVLLRDGFEAEGEISLASASARMLSWSGVKSPENATVDLRSASVGVLRDDTDSWPPKGCLRLDGLRYEHLGDGAPNEAENRIDWLHLQPQDRFRPQPYEHLAAVLRKAGHDNEAKAVLIAKAKDRLKRRAYDIATEGLRQSGQEAAASAVLNLKGTHRFWQSPYGRIARILGQCGLDRAKIERANTAMKRMEKLSRPSFTGRCWHRLLGWIIGYGYRPSLALRWIAGFIIAGTILFWLGFRDGAMAEMKAIEHVSGGGRDEFPSRCVPLYSIDMFVPVVDLHQAKYWLPDTKCGRVIDLGLVKTTSGDLLRIYMWLHISAGWVLTTLLVAGLSGLVKE